MSRHDRYDTTAATLPPSTLRDDLASTADMLDEALDALTSNQWQSQVRSALGRAIPAAEVPWMRIREVWLHAVDLGTDASMKDLPSGVVDLLLDDVSTALSGKDGCPLLDLAPHRSWPVLASGRPGPTGAVTATAADLAGWLTGRISAPNRPACWTDSSRRRFTRSRGAGASSRQAEARPRPMKEPAPSRNLDEVGMGVEGSRTSNT